jgi:hypothetical protein
MREILDFSSEESGNEDDHDEYESTPVDAPAEASSRSLRSRKKK